MGRRKTTRLQGPPNPPLTSLLGIKSKVANDFLRIQVRRPRLCIQFETISSWHRRKHEVVELSEEKFLRDHFTPFNSIWIADTTCRLFPRAVQEHWKQFTMPMLRDFFEFSVLWEVVWLSVAEGRDDKRNAMLCGRINGRAPDAMHELPESGSAEVEDRSR